MLRRGESCRKDGFSVSAVVLPGKVNQQLLQGCGESKNTNEKAVAHAGGNRQRQGQQENRTAGQLVQPGM